MTDARESAWDNLVAATPPGWYVGRRWLAMLVPVLLFTLSCELTDSAGHRLVIPVVNEDAEAATFVVADQDGRRTPASPTLVPPGRTDVTFHVPDTETWAIFVNPARIGEWPLVSAFDIGRCQDAVPIEIVVVHGGFATWAENPRPVGQPTCVNSP